MNTKADKDRRDAAKKEIEELGHIPILYEYLPSRALHDGKSMESYCQDIVRGCDAFILIIDDEISDVIYAEYNAVLQCLGRDKIFYYFTDNKNRNESARQIWNESKKGYKHSNIKTNSELRREIKKTVSSFIEDTFKMKRQEPIMLIDETIELNPDQEWVQMFFFLEGEKIIITCISSGDFYAGFFQREDFINLRTSGAGGTFGFKFGTNTPQYTEKVTIKEEDDYYLVLRVSNLSFRKKIGVEVKKI